MNTPVINAINKNAKDRKTRLCMPGHKGKTKCGKLFSSAFFDITELDYSDNLLFSESCIAESERLTARAVGAFRTFYLTTGSTTGNLISALAVAMDGQDVLVERSSHNSVFNAIGLAGLNPHFVENEISDGIPMPLRLQDVEKAYREGITALFLTSPNYFGNVAELEKICDFAHDRGMAVVCDSAHGAHFAFSDKLPKPSHAYADITVASAHKTLPVYTGGAYIHLSSDVYAERIERIRRVVHTTSPSYLVTCTMDYAQAVMSKKGEEAYDKLFGAINRLKTRSRIKVEKTDDFSRICLISRSGEELLETLKSNGIECEFAYGNRCVCIASPFDIKAVNKLASVLARLESSAVTMENMSRPVTTTAIPYREAFNAMGEYVAIEDAVGRVSASLIGLYPPAIPLVVYGEMITEETVQLIKRFPKSVYGLANGKVFVVK